MDTGTHKGLICVVTRDHDFGSEVARKVFLGDQDRLRAELWATNICEVEKARETAEDPTFFAYGYSVSVHEIDVEYF